MADLAAEIQRVLTPDYGPDSVSGLLRQFHDDAGVTDGELLAFYAGLNDQAPEVGTLNDQMWEFFVNADESPLAAVLLTENGDYLTTEDGRRLTLEAA